MLSAHDNYFFPLAIIFFMSDPQQWHCIVRQAVAQDTPLDGQIQAMHSQSFNEIDHTSISIGVIHGDVDRIIDMLKLYSEW